MASGYDGHATKRQKTDIDGHGAQQGSRDNFEDPHKPSPSPVVHVRGLQEHTLESDLVDTVQQFGPVSFVMMLPRKRQALIEFEDIQGAQTCVEYTANAPLIVAGAPAYFNYSTSQKIQRPAGNGELAQPNKILLFTVLNPQYPITVDVMHAINSPHGNILRIVIFKKNGIQAMVEFDNMDAARRARTALNGADIYSGCCTLKIEFAKQTRLNVFRNDTENWDYTNPGLGQDTRMMDRHSGKAPLLSDPHGFGGGGGGGYGGGAPRGRGPSGGGYHGMDYQDTYSHDNNGFGGSGSHGSSHGGSSFNGRGPGGFGSMGDNFDRFGSSNFGMGSGMSGGGSERGFGGKSGYSDSSSSMGPVGAGGAVLMVYGMNMEHFNCEKMFNLFCLYGNVVRIKFLKSKEGSAMIQLGEPSACERAMHNLHYSSPFGSKLQMSFSKQAYLQDVQNPHQLPDGTSSFADYLTSRNNRFQTSESASKNRVQPPSKILHYFNAPPGLDEEQLREVFESVSAKPPQKIKIFPTKSENARSSTGLLEWGEKDDACEALILANHTSIPNPAGKAPYVFKLCFSDNPISN